MFITTQKHRFYRKFKLMLGLTIILILASTSLTTTQADQWLAIVDSELSIQPGNALDFSALVEPGPAGKHGRVIVGAGNHFVYSDNPAIGQRFFCASQPYGISFPDHATADYYARQLRLHGYNAVRFHFLETTLMYGRNQDFDVDREALDRLYYFMFALKREGLYWVMDAMTSWNGAYGDIGPDRWVSNQRNTKIGVYFNPADQEHWKTLVSKLLNSQNPYTRLSPLADPALLGLILVNEGGLNHIVNLASNDMVDIVNRAFTQWLLKKYGSLDNVAKSWEINPPTAAGNIEVARNEWTASKRMTDTQYFYFETQMETLRWMTQYLRGLNYNGLISAYDNWPNLQDSVTRMSLDWVDMHAYEQEPSDFVETNSRIIQQSSLRNNLSYIRDLAITRYWPKPFTVTEYDQPFWSKWRFEAGLAMGAYAGLQDWDLICRHASGPIELAYGMTDSSRRTAIYPYGIGMDPIGRAGETLAALLFLRKDVQPAQHKLDIRLTYPYVVDEQSGIGKLPNQLSNLALLTGIGINWNNAMTASDLVLFPENNGPTLLNKLVAVISGWFGIENKSWSELITQLKTLAILSQYNLTNNRGIFQSDTEEITLDNATQILQVATSKTEAVAFSDSLPPSLPHVTIKSSTMPSLLALSALDQNRLEASGRILLIYATDAKNSGMVFADAEGQILKKLGGMPILLKNGKITLELRHQNPSALKLYALRLNGERAQQLPVSLNNTSLEITLDLSTLNYPSTFFELASY